MPNARRGDFPDPLVRALILAAGRGERMRPLTDTMPKPMLPVGGKPLVVWHIENLRRAGITQIVINHAHLGQVIEDALGDGGDFEVSIQYSREAEALETAGGIAFALPLLDSEIFAVVNGDVYSDYDMRKLDAAADKLVSAPHLLAHLVLVDNPPQHPDGDFALAGERIMRTGDPMLTFSGIGVYRRSLFSDIVRGEKAKLAPLLYRAIDLGQASGEHYRGVWNDVGTPARLANVDRMIREGEIAHGHRGS